MLPLDEVPLYRSPLLRICHALRRCCSAAMAGSTLVTEASVFLNASGSLTSALSPATCRRARRWR